MNIKLKLFFVGGLGCIAPNIVNYASTAASGGALPGNTAGTILSALLFFLLAGFLVAFILDARDIKDAFYKGVAIPALIISLANGATSPDKSVVPLLQTTPTGTQGMVLPRGNAGASLPSLTLVSIAYAQAPSTDPALLGTIRFEVQPATSDTITVTLRASDGSVLAQARSAVPNFSIRYAEGSYIADIETGSHQKREVVTVRRAETTVVRVTLEQKGFLKDLREGVSNLMKR